MLSAAKKQRLEAPKGEAAVILADDIDGLEEQKEDSSARQEEKKGLSIWIFDSRSKKRFYISRTGKVYSGADASKMYRIEKGGMLDSTTARSELHYLMNLVIPRLRDSADANGVDWGRLRSWGIPTLLEENYKEQAGVQGLFDWQIDILKSSLGGEQQSNSESNLIYSAPTSGGKTLVSEILMLRRLAMKGGTIFFVVPFVALAEQKTAYFQEMWKDMNVGVRPFHAEQALTGLTSDIDVAVCTIEKANVLINTLFEEGRQHQLSMVVIDEFHMIEDPHRGFLLEILITKCLHLLPHTTQILGMSATMPNLEDMSQWLGGHFYSSQFRPVTLQVKVCSSHLLYRADEGEVCKVREEMQQAKNEGVADYLADLNLLSRLFRQERSLHVHGTSTSNSSSSDSATSTRSARAITRNGGGGISGTSTSTYTMQSTSRVHSHNVGESQGDGVTLALESVWQGQSVLVFCGTKAVVESTADSVYGSIVSSYCSNGNNYSGDFDLFSQAARVGRFRLLDALRHTQGGLHPVLAKTVVGGVAFHHSGLMPEQRKLIETGFTDGHLRVIVATTTLAAGVNLPADRVIIKGMRTGINPLSVSAFRQMCGRAGRMGLGSTGESVLVVGDLRSPSKAADRRDLVRLIVSEPEPLCSMLHQGKGGGVEKLLLDVVACVSGGMRVSDGTINSSRSSSSDSAFPSLVADETLLSRCIACTLFHRQHPTGAVESSFRKAKAFLLHHGFLVQMQVPTAATAATAGTENGSRSTVLDTTAQTTTMTLSVSALGRAAIASGVPPFEAVHNVHFLEKARAKLVLKGDIHALFLVTPPDPRVRVRWEKFIHVWDDLCDQIPEVEEVCVSVLGVDPGKLHGFVSNPPSGAKLDTPEILFYRRFYCAIILLSIVSPSTTSVVDRHMELGPSEVYALQREASMFCRATTTFCRELNWTLLAAVLESYSDRLSFGVQEQLLPLVRACGPEIMHSRRARHLFTNGITSPAELAAHDVQELAHLILKEQPFSSREPLDQSRQPTGSKAAGNGTDTGAGVGVKSYTAEDAAGSCMTLAAIIQRKARAYLAEDQQMAAHFASL